MTKKKSLIKKKKKSMKAIKEIEMIRAKNNKNWMNLYRLAFEFAPEKASKIVKNIRDLDQKVTNVSKKL